MEKHSKISTKKIVLVALLAALTAVASGLRITIPINIGGNTYFHLGNIFCALSGILLGPWWGGLAAGLGSAIYDMFFPLFIAECWLTFLMKGAYGLVSGLIAWSGKKAWGYGKAAFGSAAGAITYALLYLVKSFVKSAFIQGTGVAGGWIAVMGKLPATIFNASVAVIFAPILAVAIRTALKKNHLSLN